MTDPIFGGHLPKEERAIAEMLIKKHNMTKSDFVRRAVKMYSLHLQREDVEGTPEGKILPALEESIAAQLAPYLQSKVQNSLDELDAKGYKIAHGISASEEIKNNERVFQIKRQAGRPLKKNKQQRPGKPVDKGTDVKRSLL